MAELDFGALLATFKRAEAGKSGGGDELTIAEKKDMVKRLVTDKSYREAYAQTRGEVIRPLLEKLVTVRKAFNVEELESGAQATFDVSFDDKEAAWVTSDISSFPTRFVEGREVNVPVFVIRGGVEFGKFKAQDGRFKIVEEANRFLANRFKFNEDLSGWSLIINVVADDAFPSGNSIEIGTSNNQTVNTDTGEGFLSKELINDMLTQGDTLEYPMDNLFVTPRSFGETRDWIPTTISENFQDQIMQAAGLTNLYGINITKHKNADYINDKKVYGINKEAFGKMIIKGEMETMDNPLSFLTSMIGVLGEERIGFFIEEAAALTEGTIDR